MTKKIMVIDDEPYIARVIKFKLEQEGYTVFSANDGLTGLEKIRLEKPDLVLLDVMMPGLTGYEVCQKIKADPALKGARVLTVPAVWGAGVKKRRPGHVRAFAVLPQLAAVGAQRDDHAAQIRRARQRFHRAAQPLAEHAALVVVDRDPAGLAGEAAQLLAAEHRQALAGVEDEGDAGGLEFARMLQHAVAAVGRDDREPRDRVDAIGAVHVDRQGQVGLPVVVQQVLKRP